MAGISVDLEAVLAQVSRQRNAALDEAAQLRAAIESLIAERDELRAEVARLSGQAALVPGRAEPEERPAQ